MNFLATYIFQQQSGSRQPDPPTHPNAPLLIPENRLSVKCVLYFKSMVLGLYESKSKPVVKTNLYITAGFHALS